MKILPLNIPGAYVIKSTPHGDDRGELFESFRRDQLRDETGIDFNSMQVNVSTSHAGVVRGIHVVCGPTSQRKYVTCVRGSIMDVIVDTRVGSPTFGEWDFAKLTDRSASSVLIDRYLGHAFIALEPSTLVYHADASYAPEHELVVNPLDPAVDIGWQHLGLNVLLSPRDGDALTLHELRDAGQLPTYVESATR